MGCELCNNEDCYVDGIYQNNEDKYILRLYTGWNEYWDDFDYGEIEVKYCPKCGRNLE